MTGTPPDVAAFIRDRLAEIEADARTAIESDLDQWGADADGFAIRFVSPGSLRGDGLGAPVAHGVTSKPVPHIARHDPAHVLAWCTAIRAVVEEYQRATRYDPDGEIRANALRDVGYRDGLEEAVRLLAAIWSAHPAYDESWR